MADSDSEKQLHASLCERYSRLRHWEIVWIALRVDICDGHVALPQRCVDSIAPGRFERTLNPTETLVSTFVALAFEKLISDARSAQPIVSV